MTLNLVDTNDFLLVLSSNRHTYELLVILLSQWEFFYLDKHGQLIHNVIKRGLSDADAEARSFSRKAFGFFRDHFPLLADALLSTLDASKKKTLLVSHRLISLFIHLENSFRNTFNQGEMSNSSSTHSLASTGAPRLRTMKE